MAWRGPRPEKIPSRRTRRRLAIRALRDQGRYGPGLREVLPALVVVVLVVCGVVAGCAVAFRALGAGVLVAALALLAVVTPFAVRHHRPLARRRLGHYTPEELAELDTEGLALAVSRMLRRDGWFVLPPSRVRDRPHVRARNGQGHRIEVAFRPVAEPLPDEDAPARSGRRASVHLRLVVHRGTFSHRDVQWARRQGDIHLIDGPRLRSWAHGTPLHRLTDAS
ncbi:hypothetical protein [Streptomyces sp. NBC_01462]|uniref:hypothetical protein n=1 Tax=Streptomyces sp. NBC_01462 TaxID=2903876 RepID=UPI002E30274D|nr:hypothetical protein [Streptomyces sp. NBC_01462]